MRVAKSCEVNSLVLLCLSLAVVVTSRTASSSVVTIMRLTLDNSDSYVARDVIYMLYDQPE
jgi:hypothetical protein